MDMQEATFALILVMEHPKGGTTRAEIDLDESLLMDTGRPTGRAGMILHEVNNLLAKCLLQMAENLAEAARQGELPLGESNTAPIVDPDKPR